MAVTRPFATTSTTDRLLEQVLDELRAIRRQNEQRSSWPSRLTRADRDRLLRILPVIAGTYGSELCTSHELIEHESAGLRLVLAGLNTKQLGRLLQRAAGSVVGGYTVKREGVEVGAVLWRVLEVPEFSR